MKGQKFFPFFFLLALPFFSTAQQGQRSPSPEQLLEIKKGQLANFEEYLYRFEVALDEGELKSMESIRKVLVENMEKAIGTGQLAVEENSPAGWLSAAKKSDLTSAPERALKAFRAYSAWQKKELAAATKQ
jgi:hypothetical protein